MTEQDIELSPYTPEQQAACRRTQRKIYAVFFIEVSGVLLVLDSLSKGDVGEFALGAALVAGGNKLISSGPCEPRLTSLNSSELPHV